MTSTKTIIYVAVGLIVALIVGCFAFFLALNGEDPNEGGGGTTDTNVSTQIPSDTSDSTDKTDESVITPPVIEDNKDGDKTDIGTIDTTIPPEEEGPVIEDYTEEGVVKIPEISDTETEDIVVNGEKDKDIVETGPASGEDRNDEIIKEKEDKAPATEKEEEKPVIVEDEKTSTEGGEKGDAEIVDEDINVDDGNKNGPEYSPSIGGDNPFDDDTQTEVDDKPVEDYVGDGEDRPGEGIHF